MQVNYIGLIKKPDGSFLKASFHCPGGWDIGIQAFFEKEAEMVNGQVLMVKALQAVRKFGWDSLCPEADIYSCPEVIEAEVMVKDFDTHINEVQRKIGELLKEEEELMREAGYARSSRDHIIKQMNFN